VLFLFQRKSPNPTDYFSANKFDSWFSYVFTYKGPNTALTGFFNAIVLIMETGFLVSAVIALILNLILPEEIENEETEEISGSSLEPRPYEETYRPNKSAERDQDGIEMYGSSAYPHPDARGP